MAKGRLRTESRPGAARLESKWRQARRSGPADTSGWIAMRLPSPHRSLKNVDHRGARRLSATITEESVAPMFEGKFRQLWTIVATIIAIAITAPTIRSRSCDDLTIDFPPVRIRSLPVSCL